MLFMLAANMVIVVIAFWSARKKPALALPAHAVAFLFVVTSPVTTLFLSLPDLRPDESPGPGDGLTAVPVLYEAALIVIFYFAGILYLLTSLFIKKLRASPAAKRST